MTLKKKKFFNKDYLNAVQNHWNYLRIGFMAVTKRFIDCQDEVTKC